MSKEAVFAIILGLILGLVFTFGLYTANQSLKQKKTEKTEQVVQATPSPSPQASLNIDLEDNIVVNQPKIDIAGKTTPLSILAFYSDSSEAFSEADENGLFSASFNLIKGSNKIKVTSFTPSNEIQEKTINIVYSTDLK